MGDDGLVWTFLLTSAIAAVGLVRKGSAAYELDTSYPGWNYPVFRNAWFVEALHDVTSYEELERLLEDARRHLSRSAYDVVVEHARRLQARGELPTAHPDQLDLL